MRLRLASLCFLALVGPSSAQYFSAGWTPGQKVTQEDKPATATFVPKASPTAPAVHAPKGTPFKLSSLLDINKLLTSEPAVAIFNNFGVNITDRVQTAAKFWDDRVDLITDDNYKDLIVNEPLTEEEEKARVWALVITVTSVKQDGISKVLDEIFDRAYNQSQVEGDLPHVKWGRIDYLNVTAITTKWNIWQAPYLVILKDRGQTLRFYRPHQLRLSDDSFRAFLKADGWQASAPWSSSFAPGGHNEYIMDFLAVWLTTFYNYMIIVPKWLMLILSGGLASVLIGVLHRPAIKKEEAAAAARAQEKAAKEARAAAATPAKSSSLTPAHTDSEHESAGASPSKRTSARQRKNKK